MQSWGWFVMAAVVLQLTVVTAADDKVVFVTVDGSTTMHFDVVRRKTLLYLYKMDFSSANHDYARVGFFNPTDMTLLAMDVYGHRLAFVGTTQPWNVTLRLSRARKGDAGFYVCSYDETPPTVFYSQGSRVDRSVELIVLDLPEKPYITFNPINPVRGHEVSFTCMTGYEPNFAKVTWRVGLDTVVPEGSGMLRVPNVEMKMSREDVTCVGTDLGGTASPRSDPVQVEVLCTQEPANYTVYETEQGKEIHIGLRLPPMNSHLGGLLILSPTCDTLIEVQYTHDGIENIFGMKDTGNAENFAIEYGLEMTILTFTVRHPNSRDAGFYLCVDRASREFVDNCGVLLIVQGLLTMKPRLEFASEPVDKEPVTLVCSARSDTMPPNQRDLWRYSFFREGRLQVNRSESNRWTFLASTRWTGADFQCSLFDGVREVRSEKITMSPDYVNEVLQISKISKDGGVTLYCHADCKPQCQVVWREKSSPVLDLDPDEVTLTQHHTCLASNYVGYASSTYTMAGHPKVISFGLGKGAKLDRLKVNDSVTLTCVTDAHYASAILDGDMRELVTESRVHVSRHRLREGMRSLRLSPLQCKHNGDYFCKVYQDKVTNLSDPDCEKYDLAGIRINVPCAPELSPLTNWQTSVYREDGESLYLQVFLSAFPPPEISWHRKYLDGSITNITEVISGSHLRSLPFYIERIDRGYLGEYILHASNVHGQMNKTFTLRHRSSVYPVTSLREEATEISSVTVTWSTVYYTIKSDISFLITLYKDDDVQEVDSFEVAMSPTCCTYILEDLQPDTAYRVEVTVINGVGARSPSEILMCRTLRDSAYQDVIRNMGVAFGFLCGTAVIIIVSYCVHRRPWGGFPWMRLPAQPPAEEDIQMEELAEDVM